MKVFSPPLTEYYAKNDFVGRFLEFRRTPVVGFAL
jgi:hypothetical protein